MPIFPDPELKRRREAAEAALEAARPKMNVELQGDEADTDHVLDYARIVLKWQVDNIDMKPSTDKDTAAARALRRAHI